eukprot:305371-Rhodomonas_salina.1
MNTCARARQRGLTEGCMGCEEPAPNARGNAGALCRWRILWRRLCQPGTSHAAKSVPLILAGYAAVQGVRPGTAGRGSGTAPRGFRKRAGRSPGPVPAHPDAPIPAASDHE